MSQAASPSTQKPYGLVRLCRVWEINRSSFYAQREREKAIPTDHTSSAQKRGPLGPCSDKELVSQIRHILETSPFHGEGHRKVWARLRHQGIRTSKRRLLRLMRMHGLLAVQRVGRPHGPKAHDGTIRTEKPNQMWATDCTTTVTLGEGQVCVFVAVEHFGSFCVGLHAAKSGNRFEALQPIRQGIREEYGAFSGKIASGLSMRHDHGSAYMSHDFQDELTFLGIASSPAFVREPEGNGCAERFIRTLKENLLWVQTFKTIEELRLALQEFRILYNRYWLLEDYQFQTPEQVRQLAFSVQEQAA
jgi:putative transposase